jgi:hypothetical protein
MEENDDLLSVKMTRPSKKSAGRKNKLLRDELTELNTYVRNDLQLTMTWYTFFLTINFVAIGWFTGVLLTGDLKTSLPVIFICIFFVVQLILSYLGLLEVHKHFKTTNDRCNLILYYMSLENLDPLSQPKNPMPFNIYAKIISLFQITFISFVFFWIALSVVSIYLVPI